MAEGILARDLWAEGLWGGGDAEPTDVVDFATREYELLLYDKNDVLLSFLPNFSNPFWTTEVNRPDILSFDYPSRDNNAARFVQPNQIWLRDRANGNLLLQRFRIMTPTLEAPDPDIIHVECLDWMSLLAEERITSFIRSTSDAATFADVIDGYLAFQANTIHIHRGVMSAAIKNRQTNTWATNKTILDAIETIHETVGGHYHVDAYRRLTWKERLGPSKGQQFRVGKNIQNLTRVGPDFTEVINRLYAYGNGSNRDTRLNLIDAGEPNEYVDDAASIASFNIKSGLWRDSEIEDAAELLAAAEFVLEQRKDPRVSYSVGVVDLTFDTNIGRNFEAIELGSVWWVIDEQVSIQTQQIVVKIVRNLRVPTDVRLEITNIPRDLSSLFKKLFRGLEELELADSADSLAQIPGLTDPSDIAWWDRVGDVGNLDDLITDMLAANPTAILSDLVPDPIVALGSAAAGTGVKASREDHKHGNIATNLADIQDVGGAAEAVGATGRIADAGHIHGLDAEIATWDVVADTGTLDDLMTDVLAANPTAVLSDVTPESVIVLGSAAPGTGVKASREDHKHGDIATAAGDFEPIGFVAAVGSVGRVADAGHVHTGGAIIQDTEPAANVWPQGIFWINKDDAGTVKQIWFKTHDDNASNESAVALGKMTTSTLT